MSNKDIHILTTKNCWFELYIQFLQDKLRDRGFMVSIYYDASSLPKGEILFILSYYKLLNSKALKKHDYNIVIHASDLPKGKGFSPMAWQILEGKQHIDFTLFEATEECDAGDYYLKKKLCLNGYETYQEWRDLEGDFVVNMVVEYIDRFDDLEPIPQSGDESIYRKRGKNDDEISVENSIKEIFDKLRICDPEQYPVWFEHRGRKYNLKLEAWD
tara:strand:- start:14445 stop:15089 length:645 start_codon:yes stop_codon:yes gene_type:complete